MTHSELIDRAARWVRGTLKCGVVLTERQSGAGETPDVIGWSTGGLSHVVEVKVSRSDFLRDRHKAHRRVPMIAMGAYRWYVTPPTLLSVDDLPPGFGLAEIDPRLVRIRRRAEHQGDHDAHREKVLLLSELRRYQIHGITYPPLADGSMPGRVPGFDAAQEPEPR